jgi:hypothetical protein
MDVNPEHDQHRRNRLLDALRPGDYALLERHLQIVPIADGELLHLPGKEIEQVYFLHRGIVALMAISEDGDGIATASVGSEGAIGTIAGTGFVRAFTRALVQAPGIAVPHFRRGPVAVGSERAKQGRHHLIQPGSVGRYARAAPIERDIGCTDAAIPPPHKVSTRTNRDRQSQGTESHCVRMLRGR